VTQTQGAGTARRASSDAPCGPITIPAIPSGSLLFSCFFLNLPEDRAIHQFAGSSRAMIRRQYRQARRHIEYYARLSPEVVNISADIDKGTPETT